ncbi:MAG TPA: branched-chain amino acid ABC transporter permease [Anaerolineales bacterium]|nr:branched-chain amino acid ABC transporter permease [Anaerolineales bacterium]
MLDVRAHRRRRLSAYQIVQITLGVVFGGYLLWRLFDLFFAHRVYGPETWVQFALSGVVLGSVYAIIAIGYTLVYGILFMINFAHGDIMMIGCFGGYFVFEALKAIPAGTASNPDLKLLDAQPVLAVVLAFAVGISIAALSGFYLEKIAYRPLRGAPRLVPLISAIGASIFLENAAQLLFGAQRRDYANPAAIERGAGWTIPVGNASVVLTYTGVLTLVLSVLLMVALYLLVKQTRLGRAMRAVAENKPVAELMGIDVDGVISRTFIISGALAGAAGVMWGIHLGLVYYFVGFIPGIKAFTAAVLGGIGNIPGAMLGGLFLGVVEALGPAILGLNFQLKDVIAFGILVLVLIFRPTGILGEVLSEDKV